MARGMHRGSAQAALCVGRCSRSHLSAMWCDTVRGRQALGLSGFEPVASSLLLCYRKGDLSAGTGGERHFVIGVRSVETAWLLDTYGDVIYLDATHSINNRKCPNMIVLVADAHNHSHLVALFCLMHEAHDDIRVALEALRDFAPSWTPRAAVIDKSEAFRNAIVGVWPTCSIVLCRWHVLQAVEKFCKSRFAHLDAIVKYQLSYVFRARTQAEFAHLRDKVCAEKYLQGLSEDITLEKEQAIVTYFQRQWLESSSWKTACVDCFWTEHRTGGTNMFSESFFRHWKDACRIRSGPCQREWLRAAHCSSTALTGRAWLVCIARRAEPLPQPGQGPGHGDGRGHQEPHLQGEPQQQPAGPL